MAIRSTATLNHAPAPANETPQVTHAKAKGDVLAAGASGPDQSVTADPKAAKDPNQVYYVQTARSILNPFNSNFPDQYNFGSQKLANLIKEQTEAFDTDALKASYAKGTAASMASVLADSAIIQFAKPHKPSDVVESVIDSCTREFNQQVKAAQTKNDAARVKYLTEQRGTQKSLYAAAAHFGTFLLIVFLSIVIKMSGTYGPRIERRPNISVDRTLTC